MEHVVPGALRRLRATDIISMAGLAAATRGQEYARLDAVQATRRDEGRLSGIVEIAASSASEPSPEEEDAFSFPEPDAGSHYVTVELQGAMQWQSSCTCEAPSTALCEHAAALLYEWLAHPGLFRTLAAQAAMENRPQKERLHDLVNDAAAVQLPTSKTPREKPSSRTGGAFRPILPPQHTLVQVGGMQDILPQLGISELRSIARAYAVTAGNMNKPQLIAALLEQVARPEAVKKVAASLEKPLRQFLAAITLYGSAIPDEELRALYDRFALGQPAHYQQALASLQSEGLLFRTSLNSVSLARGAQGSGQLEIGWFVPLEVRAALKVTVPMTPYTLPAGAQEGSERDDQPRIRSMEPLRLLSELLLLVRLLDGTSLDEESSWLDFSDTLLAEFTGTVRASDGSFLLQSTSDQPPESLIARLRERLPRSRTFLRFALRLLRGGNMLRRADDDRNRLHIADSLAEKLLGEAQVQEAQELFMLWLKHSSIDELLGLREDGVDLRCRANTLRQPVLRMGELEIENSEARQLLVSLLAQVTPGQWMHFGAFARFVYRLNPLFLQRRQRYFASPHWWLEDNPDKPLKPSQFKDWQRAEHHYLAQLIQGPLYWWGICDIVSAPDGALLAFRLTPLASWLLQGNGVPGELERGRRRRLTRLLVVVDAQEVLVPAHPAAWNLIKVLERFAQATGIQRSYLRYRFTPQALSKALRAGEDTKALFKILRLLAQRQPELADALTQVIARLERLQKSYGQVRFYTHVPLLEVADQVVMRELEATTSLNEVVARPLSETMALLHEGGATRLSDELKRRGSAPLVHEKDSYEAE